MKVNLVKNEAKMMSMDILVNPLLTIFAEIL